MTVATARLLSADPYVYDRVVQTSDGVTPEYQVPNAPIVTGTAKVYVNTILAVLNTDYTINEALGVVTFLPGHIPAINLQILITYQFTYISDADLTTIWNLVLYDDRLAAAHALDIMASTESIVQKKVRLLDFQSDGPAVAEQLRVHAKELRRQVNDGDGDWTGLFDWAEQVIDDFGLRERLVNQLLREAN